VHKQGYKFCAFLMQCFLMLTVMNKCFFLNPEKYLAQIYLVVFEKTQKSHTLIPTNDVTEPKALISTNTLITS